MAYLLDANVFIEAKNRYYGLDFCPAFWDWLLTANARGRVVSIDRVLDELEAIQDELTEWAQAHKAEMFQRLDADVVPALATVAAWASSQSYEQGAVDAFLEGTDYYLVAYALAHEHVLVTHEVASTSTRKIKIPNACLGVGVRFMNTWEMLRRERARFVLGSAT